MFANVVNSIDFPLWSNFFGDFYCPDFSYVQTAPSFNDKAIESALHDTPKQIHVNNAGFSCQFMFNNLTLLPDFVMKTGDAKIFSYPDGSHRSIITCSLEVTGTQLQSQPHEILEFAVGNTDEGKTGDNSSQSHVCERNDNEELTSFPVNFVSYSGRKGQLKGYSVEKYQEFLN